MKTLIEKCNKYNKPFFLIFVEYEKAYDTVSHWKMLQSLALAECRSDHRYIAIIKNINKKVTAHVKLHDNTQEFRIERGVRQVDEKSPNLLTSLLEYMLKRTNFGEMGININYEKLKHLRFADDIVLITDRIDEAKEMLSRLYNVSKSVG